MKIRLLVLFLLVLCSSCRSPTDSGYVIGKVPVRGLILPGRVDQGENVQAKFIWHGGGALREISHVAVNQESDRILVTPMGKYLTGGIIPCDAFTRIDTVSLVRLEDASYEVVIIGDSDCYFDSLAVPSSAPESLFQFEIKTVYPGTRIPAIGVGLYVRIFPPADTTLVSMTDSSGVSTLTHSWVGVDTLSYELGFTSPPGYLGMTQIRLGTPEVITLGAE
jgi:hypothetical protein